ncbi:hypothetical protein ACFQBQ_14875 [Granulicella cerasi]|uniref:Uncharacterized protein n=1 Tax=Granulicella cerasi TaxID=741063 RepID=A0ABW1ZBH7_9BACT|nr:hypothetical protein [Granulicella cerasi]
MQTFAYSIWGISIAAFVILMVYRANLTNHETDQLFLGDEDGTNYHHQEQAEIVRRVDRVTTYCRGVGGVAALTTIAVVGLVVHNIVHTAF